MEGCPCLPLPKGLRITQFCQENSVLVVSVVSTRSCSCCHPWRHWIAQAGQDSRFLICSPETRVGAGLWNRTVPSRNALRNACETDTWCPARREDTLCRV